MGVREKCDEKSEARSAKRPKRETAVESHPFRKVREKDGAPPVLLMRTRSKAWGHPPDSRKAREVAHTRHCDFVKIPKLAAFVESHPSQSALRMGHPLCCFCRRDQEPGRTPVQVGAACR